MEIEKSILFALRQTDFPEYDSLLNPNGVIAVIANQDQPEPRAPYLLINLINTRKIGMPYKSVINDGINIKERIYQVKDFYVSLTLHAKTKDPSQEWFKHLENGIHSDMVSWAFSQQGLGLVESDDIIYQSQPISGVAYKRAMMNITVRAEISDSYKVNFIDRVEIDGYLSGKHYTFFANTYPVSFLPTAGGLLETLVNNYLPETPQ